MTDKLVDFMTELATNSEMQEAYAQSPRALMEKHQIEEEDIRLMENSDIDAIKERIGSEYEVSEKDWITASKVKK